MGDKDLMFGLLICMLGGIIVLYSLMRIYFNKRQKKKTLEPKFCIENHKLHARWYVKYEGRYLVRNTERDGSEEIYLQDYLYRVPSLNTKEEAEKLVEDYKAQLVKDKIIKEYKF